MQPPFIGGFFIFVNMEKEIFTTYKIRFIDCDPIGHLNNSKYIDYMLNAREDHVEIMYGFTYEEHLKKTGCSWIAIQNEIAYLKEVRANQKVDISSKVVSFDEKTAIVEILMRDHVSHKINAIFWCTVIYFDLKLRKATRHSQDIMDLFSNFLVPLKEETFKERVNTLRMMNKNIV